MSNYYGGSVLISEKIVESKKIDDYINDITEKQLYFPNVNKIQIVKQTFEDINKEQTINTVERQFKKYSVRSQIKSLVDKVKLKNEISCEKVIYMETPVKSCDLGQGYIPIYIPNINKYESILNKKEEKMELYQIDKSKIEDIIVKEPDSYMPPDVKTGENVSIVVKEIPNYMTLFEVKKLLKEMFSRYGMILNINVLGRYNDELKTNMPSGLAFIDFSSKEDVDKLLNSNERFRISNSILKLELANSSKKS
jgi:hypothetical protein